MTRHDMITLLAVLAIVIIGNPLGALLSTMLFDTGIISHFGAEIGWIVIAVVPASAAGLLVVRRGHRSGYWFWILLPGLIVWFLRPWPSLRTRWYFLDIGSFFAAYAKQIWPAIWHDQPLSPHAIAFFTGFFVVLFLAALITGRTILQVKRDMRAVGRGGWPGGGSADGSGKDRAGLPQASWASTREVRERFGHPGGIVLGELTDPLRDSPNFTPSKPRSWKRQGRGRLITMDPADGNGHVLVTSQASAYKSTGIVISNILHYDDPIIVFDPKCELYARTAQARRDMGYDAVVIDAQNGYDPARLIALLAQDHPSAYLRMARMMIPRGFGDRGMENGQFFKDAATALFTGLLGYYAETGSQNIVGNVARVLSLPPDRVHESVRDNLKHSKYEFIVNRLNDLAEMEGRFYHSIKTEITNSLLFAEFPDIQRYATMSPDSPLLAQLVDPKTDIFLNIPQHVAEDFAPMLRLMLGSFLVAAQLVEVNEAPRARRLLIIDEAAKLGNMDILENIRDRGRSIGLHLMMFYQTPGEIAKLWGREGMSSWRDGCSATVMGPVSARESAQDLSTMLGSRTLRVTTGGSSSQHQVMSTMGGSVGSSESEQLRDIPLLTPTMISQLPRHSSIITVPGCKPILATKAIWFTRKDMRDKVRSTEEIAANLDVTENQRKLIERLQNPMASQNMHSSKDNRSSQDTQSSQDTKAEDDAHETGREDARAQTEPADGGETASQPAGADGTPDAVTDTPAPIPLDNEPDTPNIDSVVSDADETSVAPEPDGIQSATSGQGRRTVMEASDSQDPQSSQDIPCADDVPMAGDGTVPPPQMPAAKPLATDVDFVSSEPLTVDEYPDADTNTPSKEPQDDQPDLPGVDNATDSLDEALIIPAPASGQSSPAPRHPTITCHEGPPVMGFHSEEFKQRCLWFTEFHTGQTQFAFEEWLAQKGISHVLAETEKPTDGTTQPALAKADNGKDRRQPKTPNDQAPVARGPSRTSAPPIHDDRTAQPKGTTAHETKARVEHQSQAARASRTPPTANDDSQAADDEDAPHAPSTVAQTVQAQGAQEDEEALVEKDGRQVPAGNLAFAWVPKRVPALLRPLHNLWARYMTPRMHTPLNISLHTGEIIPHPNDVTDGLWIIRVLDRIDWYLGHPDGRYELYDLKRRRRQFDGLEWRLHLLRCWIRNEPRGLPPGLRPNGGGKPAGERRQRPHGGGKPAGERRRSGYPNHATLRARISPATKHLVPTPARYDPVENAVHLPHSPSGPSPPSVTWTTRDIGPIPPDQPQQLVFEHVAFPGDPNNWDRDRYLQCLKARLEQDQLVDSLLRLRLPPLEDDMLFFRQWPEIPVERAARSGVKLCDADIPLCEWNAVLWLDRLGNEWRLFRQAVNGLTGTPLGAARTWPISTITHKWLDRPIVERSIWDDVW